MKKIISLIILSIMLVTIFTGCGNMSLGVGNFEFNKIHVDTYHYNGCFTIDKWHDNENGIEVKTKEVGSIYLSEGMYILIKDDCPFCASEIEEN